jgi:hypothetical protein
MGTETRFQVADVHASHGTSIADVTILVIFHLSGRDQA